MPTKKKAKAKHDVPFMVRLTTQEMKLYEGAANYAGLSISAWIRGVCTAAIRGTRSAP
jgi:hypothetical protein